jgi:hypothetical protein
MRRKLIPLTGLALAAAAWAQDPASPSPSELADQAMKVMDALSAPPAPGSKTVGAPQKADKGTSSKKAPAGPRTENEEEETDGPSLLPAPKDEAARGMDPMSRARLDLMVPTGRSHRGVHYPMYRPVETDRSVIDPVLGGVAGVTAPLASLFESDQVTRLDDDHVQFDRAKWIQFDEKAAPDGKAKPTMSLEIERGVYDLKNEILMTNQPVKIENDQFLITGDTMLHDRASGLTRLTGRVKMTFYNEEPEPAPAAAPAPASPEKPRQP